jgi:LPXTG-site transpeptidase (sortase) family protein
MKFKALWTQSDYRNLFLVLAGIIFLFLFAVVYALNMLPAELGPSEPASPAEEVRPAYTNEPEVKENNAVPVRIEIASVGIDTSVSHPQVPTVEVLDNALLKGAVYYPGSGTIGEGNMFVFGHSTGLSVVRNQAFKAFNNLKNVKAGDVIRVTGTDGQIYLYEAISIELVDENEALVQFNTREQMITLSTCNTFGEKQERHVVKAVLKGQE